MVQQLEQLMCNTSIDYSKVIGEKILPFIIELDLQASILNPSPGQNQRFCYKVTRVGPDNTNFVDLSNLVLGICNQIPQNQIVNITVTINGLPQAIVFGTGGNVELKSSQQPDIPTGCTGLKFDFPLNKVASVMLFCFELTTPYAIGPNVVCLSGGGITVNKLSICGPVCNGEIIPVEVTGFQTATVFVPVTVTPFARAGTPTTFCRGDVAITQGPVTHEGTVNGSYTFTITQGINIAVPVVFGATAAVGTPSVEGGIASRENICTNCNNDANSTEAAGNISDNTNTVKDADICTNYNNGVAAEAVVQPNNISDNINMIKQKSLNSNSIPYKSNVKK